MSDETRGPRTPTDPLLRSPMALLETLQHQCQSLGTKIAAVDEEKTKTIALLTDRVTSLETDRDTLRRTVDTQREELRNLRIELRDLKMGRSKIIG